jgi:hypothetical protein
VVEFTGLYADIVVPQNREVLLAVVNEVEYVVCDQHVKVAAGMKAGKGVG